jgi:hypothetical protein
MANLLSWKVHVTLLESLCEQWNCLANWLSDVSDEKSEMPQSVYFTLLFIS